MKSDIERSNGILDCAITTCPNPAKRLVLRERIENAK